MSGRIRRLLWHALNLGLPAGLVLVPILGFILLSFWKLDEGRILREFTLGNYATFWSAGSYREFFAGTVALSAEVTAVNVAWAWGIALFIHRRPARVRFLLLTLFVLPLFMSYIIKIYSLRGIMGQRGLLNEGLLALGLIDHPLPALLFSRTAIFIVLAIVYLPFAILPIHLALDRIPANYRAAAADLGGGAWHELRYILAPLSLPGVLLAAVFTFVLTFGDFVTPQMVGGVEGFTFGRIVFSQFGLALNWPLGAALAVVLLGTALAFLLSFDETLITLFLSGSVTTLPIRLWAMMRVGFVPEINALATLVLVLVAAAAGIVAVVQQRTVNRAA